MDTRQEKLEQIEDAQFALLMYDLAVRFFAWKNTGQGTGALVREITYNIGMI